MQLTVLITKANQTTVFIAITFQKLSPPSVKISQFISLTESHERH